MNRLLGFVTNRQSRQLAPELIKWHYDIGNDLYSSMLDKRLTYSCGYWKNATTLDEAQEHKFDLICRKLNLRAGQNILDIGCGWGSFMKYAVEKYQVSCVGVTLSSEQVALGKELCRDLPIEIRLADYRELEETFDHIVSIGMFEHVGFKNYSEYMRVVRRCLRTCFKSCYAARLLRCAVLAFLMYVQYIPASALRAPCTRAARDAFKTRS